VRTRLANVIGLPLIAAGSGLLLIIDSLERTPSLQIASLLADGGLPLLFLILCGGVLFLEFSSFFDGDTSSTVDELSVCLRFIPIISSPISFSAGCDEGGSILPPN